MLGGVALFLTVTACGATAVAPTGYALTDDTGRTLRLTVPGGIGDEVSSAIVVSQDDQAVTVKVEVKRADGSRADVEVPLTPELDLSQPLGTRTVRDASGVTIPRQ